MTGTGTTAAALCVILADVIGVEHVSPGDGFFQVGGDSVLAVRVVARAREAGLAFSVRDLFDHQTPEALAAAVASRAAAASAGEAGSEAEAGASRAAEAAQASQAPLLTFTDDEFGEFEDGQVSGTDVEWETIT
jgi:aryl carrier-like protein